MTESEMKEYQRDAAYLRKQERVADLADKLLAERMAEGLPFSHGLCDWALNEAERRLGIYPLSGTSANSYAWAGDC